MESVFPMTVSYTKTGLSGSESECFSQTFLGAQSKFAVPKIALFIGHGLVFTHIKVNPVTRHVRDHVDIKHHLLLIIQFRKNFSVCQACFCDLNGSIHGQEMS